jgi:hypothetical protein
MEINMKIKNIVDVLEHARRGDARLTGTKRTSYWIIYKGEFYPMKHAVRRAISFPTGDDQLDAFQSSHVFGLLQNELEGEFDVVHLKSSENIEAFQEGYGILPKT